MINKDTLIIDMHSHVGHFDEVWSPEFSRALMNQFAKFPKWFGDKEPWRLEEFDVATEDYIRYMDEIGIDKAMIMGQSCEPFCAKTDPKIIGEIVKKYPDRFFGWYACDPIGYTDETPAVLEKAVKDYDLKGVKVFPGYINAHAGDARLFPVYQKAAELDLVLTIHTGYTCTHSGPGRYAPLELQYPLYVEEVAATFPKLRIILAHFANPWSKDAIQVMRKYDNVYADTAYGAFPLSWKVEALTWAKNFGLMHKVLYGSDYPLHCPEESIELHRGMPSYCKEHNIQPYLTDEDIELVLGLNAVRMLRLEI